jgi:Na+/H+ antiporter NhaD/arsenite permease-like protein
MSIQNILIVCAFLSSYLLITFEQYFKINKTVVALIAAALAWAIVFSQGSAESIQAQLVLHMGTTSQLVLFLFGAMAIVEVITAYRGFAYITNRMKGFSKKTAFWAIGVMAFLFSAVIDNLTATLLFVSLTQKLMQKKEDRLLFGGMIVIAANAGGAWTPIGDVTTTMLWIGGQISSLGVMKATFIPCLVCFFAAVSVLSLGLSSSDSREKMEEEPMYSSSGWILLGGMGVLMGVPLMKLIFGIPPFLAVLVGLAILWFFIDRRGEDSELKVETLLRKVDYSTLLFFLGILLSVNALEEAKILEQGAAFFYEIAGEAQWIAIGVGVLSAVVDNVPLVAALQGMYSSQFLADAPFWHLLSFTTGTGGSLLVIGSAAGIAFMGLEKVTFFSFLRKISLAALIGYIAGVAVFFLI